MAVSTIDALYHSGSEKLTTSATGITVTGTVAATAYTGDGSALTGTGSPSIVDNGNATAITIDSSENVLYGTTDTTLYNNTTGTGTKIGGDGRLDVARQADTVATFNRTGSSDGEVIRVVASGTTVGSIGASSDGASFGNATQHVAMHSGKLFPASPTHSTLDNTIDLGYSAGRFKDLYLSGGVYLGGTGSANKLDDYEEGTWTPQLSSDVSITSYTILNGYYTKVGRLVTVSATVQAASLGSWSGASINLYGLPFTVSNASNNEAVGTLAMRGTTGDKDGLYIRFIQNGTNMRLEHRTGYQSDDPNMPANTIDTGTKIYVTGSYFVA